jgi:hypothetical protein
VGSPPMLASGIFVSTSTGRKLPLLKDKEEVEFSGNMSLSGGSHEEDPIHGHVDYRDSQGGGCGDEGQGDLPQARHLG